MWNINIIKEKGEILHDYLFPLADWGSKYNLYIASMVSFGDHDDLYYFVAGKEIDDTESIQYCRINMLKPEYVDYGDTSPLSGLKLSTDDIEYMIRFLSGKYRFRPDREESNIIVWHKMISYNNESHSMDQIYHPNCTYSELPLDLPIPDYTKLLQQ